MILKLVCGYSLSIYPLGGYIEGGSGCSPPTATPLSIPPYQMESTPQMGLGVLYHSTGVLKPLPEGGILRKSMEGGKTGPGQDLEGPGPFVSTVTDGEQ